MGWGESGQESKNASPPPLPASDNKNTRGGKKKKKKRHARQKKTATSLTHRCCFSCGPLSSLCRFPSPRLFCRCAPHFPARTCEHQNAPEKETRKKKKTERGIWWHVPGKGCIHTPRSMHTSTNSGATRIEQNKPSNNSSIAARLSRGRGRRARHPDDALCKPNPRNK